MGQGAAPASGYMLSIEKAKEKFEADIIESARQIALKAGDEKLPENWEQAVELLDEECIDNVTAEINLVVDGENVKVDVYRYDGESGDCYDDLTDGLYLQFYEDDLWVRQETHLLRKLSAMGMEPAESHWTVYG